MPSNKHIGGLDFILNGEAKKNLDFDGREKLFMSGLFSDNPAHVLFLHTTQMLVASTGGQGSLVSKFNQKQPGCGAVGDALRVHMHHIFVPFCSKINIELDKHPMLVELIVII